MSGWDDEGACSPWACSLLGGSTGLSMCKGLEAVSCGWCLGGTDQNMGMGGGRLRSAMDVHLEV